MALSKKLVLAYQCEFRKKFGKEISAKDAERELFDLATLIKLITKERKNNHDR